ncbi:MAG: glycerol-3-phosphate 1-O-acyltransferase PlsY [Dehalococcoidia bacterium]|nr:glycerol-3-phosphate 1-O-acyltransferase PlsY [Dehalococcoidia bacterium]
MNPLLATIIAGGVGYLIGALPFGLWVGRAAGVDDVRKYGSGKTGFTNSLRTMGVKWAVLVVAGDVLKGVVAVLIGRYLFDASTAGALAGAAAVFGHVFPVWAGFRGGRGVSTAFGAFLAVSPVVALILFGVSLLVLAAFRYASLMSVTGVFTGLVAIAVMAVFGWLDYAYLVLFAVPTASVVEFSHIGNIKRLLAGTEPKLGQGGERRAAGAG